MWFVDLVLYTVFLLFLCFFAPKHLMITLSESNNGKKREMHYSQPQHNTKKMHLTKEIVHFNNNCVVNNNFFSSFLYINKWHQAAQSTVYTYKYFAFSVRYSEQAAFEDTNKKIVCRRERDTQHIK